MAAVWVALPALTAGWLVDVSALSWALAIAASVPVADVVVSLAREPA